MCKNLCNTCGREIIAEQGCANEVSNGNHYGCDKCNKQFLDLHRLNQHKTKEHGTSYKCDVCQELEASEATGIGYICFICDAEFEIAAELENHVRTHENVLPH
jgi:DNA-directed RNA polymerase subunit RPC12/RpoP